MLLVYESVYVCVIPSLPLCPIAELGDYDPYKHSSGYVSEYRFVPDQKKELEDAVERIHKTIT